MARWNAALATADLKAQTVGPASLEVSMKVVCRLQTCLESSTRKTITKAYSRRERGRVSRLRTFGASDARLASDQQLDWPDQRATCKPTVIKRELRGTIDPDPLAPGPRGQQQEASVCTRKGPVVPRTRALMRKLVVVVTGCWQKHLSVCRRARMLL